MVEARSIAGFYRLRKVCSTKGQSGWDGQLSREGRSGWLICQREGVRSTSGWLASRPGHSLAFISSSRSAHERRLSHKVNHPPATGSAPGNGETNPMTTQAVTASRGAASGVFLVSNYSNTAYLILITGTFCDKRLGTYFGQASYLIIYRDNLDGLTSTVLNFSFRGMEVLSTSSSPSASSSLPASIHASTFAFTYACPKRLGRVFLNSRSHARRLLHS